MERDPRRRLAPDERRSELLEFGRRFFSEHPADAFSMAEIAERAGVSKGLLYNYFGGRRGFYVATVEAIAREVAARTEPEPDMPFAESFRRALARYLSWVGDHGDVYRVLVQGGLGVDPQVGAIIEQLRRESVARIVARKGIEPTAAVEIAVYGWVCFAEHACLEWLRRRDAVDREEMVELLSGALSGALASAGVAWEGAADA